jgi:hypothetical protein
VISGPVRRHFGTSQFGAVVAAQDAGVAALGGQAIQFGNEVRAGHVAFDQAAEAVAKIWTTCSGLCLFLVGRKTLTTMDQLTGVRPVAARGTRQNPLNGPSTHGHDWKSPPRHRSEPAQAGTSTRAKDPA